MAAAALAMSAGNTLIALLIGAVIFVIVVVVCAVLLALLHVVLPQGPDAREADGDLSAAEAGPEPAEAGDVPHGTVA